VVASNSPALPNVCDEVSMWVYEEEVNGRNLSHIINTEHENAKYLPGVKLPPNLVAEPDLERAVCEASVLVWVLPHQFLSRLLPRVKAVMRKDAISVSLIKGMAVGQDGTLQLVSSHIAQGLGVSEVAVLMGANVADQVARDELCEATLGVSHPSLTPVLLPLFDRACFRVRAVSDVAGVEVCGALKNVVALAAGFADGLGLGSNTKAALMRIGMAEIIKFALRFYPGVDKETMWESCGKKSQKSLSSTFVL
jgi:glycerol-3-phosphate dehydrogenase (NAD+)